MRACLTMLVSLCVSHALGQTSNGTFIKEKNKGCLVWVANLNPADSLSITWDGPCVDKKADGRGTMTWYVRGQQVATYTGEVRKGNQNGRGRFSFPNGVVQEGHFVDGVMNGEGRIVFPDTTKKIEGYFHDGEILNLDPAYRQKLIRNLVSNRDSTALYVNDRNSTDLFYYSLVPPGKTRGVLVLLAGTWDRAEYVLSNNKTLVQLAYEQGFAVLVPSVNQRLTLNTDVLQFLNKVFAQAISTYHLPPDKFILGGFSMGGLFSLRYTELAYADGTQTAVKPLAVYSVDGPTDLENMYRAEERALEQSPNKTEASYALTEFRNHMGGSPETHRQTYQYYSAFSQAEKNGGNARFLQSVPVRIYNDVDVSWWLENRNSDLYDMNALDQSAMIRFLQANGNKRAEFINALGKGYRLDGTRHPHSWSIVDPVDCVNWLSRCVQ